MPSFEILPVEIHHRIFDHLDIQTILFTFRHVCRRFYSIVDTYRSYRLNFEEISQAKFHRICRIIPLEYVVALTLSDKDQTHGQIRLFLSLFNLNQFIRLRSLTLLQIDDDQLNIFIHFILQSSITSLSIDSETFNIRQNTSLKLLSSVIEHGTLEKLDLNMRSKDINEIQWPINCTLTSLRIRTKITFHQYFLILQFSPCLKTIVLKDLTIDQTDLQYGSFSQVKSLTCEDARIQMTKFERCLSLTPALLHLKLIGNGNLFDSSFDGHRWEKLIEQHLAYLEKFQFFISVLTHVNFDTDYVEEIISHYRTSFWIDGKGCFVRCDYIVYLHQLILYSLPVCTSRFEYHSDIHLISALNAMRECEDLMIMENIKRLDLNLTKFHRDEEREKEKELLFRNVTEFRLGIDGKWPKGSLGYLSTTIDLLQITKLHLSINFSHEYMPSIVYGVHRFLKQAVNIQSLSLFDHYAPGYCTTTMENICEMVTSTIRHLQILVRNSDDIQFILAKLTHLISVTFEFTQSLIIDQEEFINGLLNIPRQLSKWKCQHTLRVWLDHQ